MHEYSIVAELMERVEQELSRHPGAVPRRVHLRIGEHSGVEIGLLRTAFDMVRVGGICGSAELEIVAVPACWRCRRSTPRRDA